MSTPKGQACTVLSSFLCQLLFGDLFGATTLQNLLLQDYNCEIGACLLQLKERQDGAVQARMQVLTLEALSLTGRTMLNPANHRAIVNARLDDAAPVSQKPGKAFYQGLLVSRLLTLC